MNQNVSGKKVAEIPDGQKPHILIIDDDDRIRQLVSRYLRNNDFIVSTAADAAEGRKAIDYFSYDALIVDIMMPGEDGLAFTRALRDSGNDLPVLHLTALGETKDLVRGFESGGDDYLAKPFEPDELIARLQALIRRRPKSSAMTESVTLGPWIFNPERNELEAGDESIRLTDVEGSLLKALLRFRGDVVSREKLSELCDIEGSSRAIDVQVTRLRRKLEDDPKNPRILLTVRGKGYRLTGNI